MKKYLFIFVLAVGNTLYAQNIGINGTGATPDAGAMLDVVSTTKGLLIPRVSIANLSTIAPVTGTSTESMLVYNTNTTTGKGYYYWNGTLWVKFVDTGGAGGGIYGGDGTTPSDVDVTVTDNIDFDASTFFIDGTNNRVGIGTAAPGVKLEIKQDIGPYSLASEFDFGQFLISGFTNGNRGITMGFDVSNNFGYIYSREIGIGAKDLILQPFGNVGIGTTTPGTKLEIAGQVKITGGTPGANKVLTSDATGLATWQTPTTSSATKTTFTDVDTQFYSDSYLEFRYQSSGEDIQVRPKTGHTGWWDITWWGETHEQNTNNGGDHGASDYNLASVIWYDIEAVNLFTASMPSYGGGAVIYIAKESSNAYPLYEIRVIRHGSYITTLVQVYN